MFFDLERNSERTILDELKQSILCATMTPEQIHGLREHRLTHQEWRIEFLYAPNDPGVVPLGTTDKSDQRSRVNDGEHRDRSPRDAWGSRRDRVLPNRPSPEPASSTLPSWTAGGSC